MPQPFYVEISGEKQGKIDGDVDQKDRENMIRGYSFENRSTIPRHEDTGRPQGVCTHHPVYFTKQVDKSSAALWKAMSSGERVDARFDFYEIAPDGQNKNHYSIALKEGIIVEMQTLQSDTKDAIGLQADGIRERLGLVFKEIEWKHHDSGTSATSKWTER